MLARILRRGEPDEIPIVVVPMRVLSSWPPVLMTGLTGDMRPGIADAFGLRYGNTPAGFIVFPTWTIEKPGRTELLRRNMLAHAERYPNHAFTFIANTQAETDLLNAAGVPAFFLNKNFMVSEEIFRPLPDVPVEFDAIYNARFVPKKRHWLAAQVPSVGYVTYVDRGRRTVPRFRRQLAAALAANPAHRLLNRMEDGKPVRMSHEEVNVAMSRAAVGLLLSEEEGSSYASMEYMLAGMPLVSTPSRGGRDVYYDPEFCFVCEPTPEAVRDAVAMAQSRKLDREHIRRQALAKIQSGRMRLLALADELIVKLGGQPRLAEGPWPFGDISGVPWRLVDKHLAAFGESARAALCESLGLAPELLGDVQLEATEISPVAEAIRAKPGCSLLVFGCGNDSAFWEALNSGGTTVFIEDDAQWANLARSRLSRSKVHLVQYGSRLLQWRWMLDRPNQLAMDLPEEVAGKRWDVILVDGPAGYHPLKPGRMKSIFTASRLVAPGGRVFVHDVDRPAERAFADKYLGEARCVVEAKGHATLKGYAF